MDQVLKIAGKIVALILMVFSMIESWNKNYMEAIYILLFVIALQIVGSNISEDK